MTDFDKLCEEIENASAEESRHLNKLFIAAFEADRKDRKKNKNTAVVCATICVVAVLLLVALLGVLASGVQIETTTKETSETTTQSGEGDSVQFNNIEGDQSITDWGGE